MSGNNALLQLLHKRNTNITVPTQQSSPMPVMQRAASLLVTWFSIDIFRLEVLRFEDDDGQHVLCRMIGEAHQKFAELLLDRRVERLPVSGLRREVDLEHNQCDQIGRFIGFWATFQSLGQQIVCPNLSHS